MPENTEPIFPLKPLRFKLFVKLYNMDREGTMKDFAEALAEASGSMAYHASHNDFVRDMIQIGVLEQSKRHVVILGRNYQNFRINHDKMKDIMKEFFDEELLQMVQDLVDDGYLVFRF